MKKLLVLSAAALGLLAFAGKSQAQIITSVQFYSNDPSLTASQFAGVDSVDNWNTLNPTYIGSTPAGGWPTTNALNNLVNSSGTVQTGLDASLSSGGGFGFGGGTGFTNGTPAGTANNTLLTSGPIPGWNSVPTDTLTLSGLNPGDNYSLIVYVPVVNGSGAYAEISQGTTNFFVKSGTGLGGVFTPATGNSVATAAAANYAMFTGITGSSTESFSVTYTGTSYAGLAGFQLIDNGAATTPEPSTYVLVGLGLLSLVVVSRRKLQV